MSATYDLFLRWMTAKKITSAAAGAAALGLTRQGVHEWKNGRNGSLPVIERMCRDLGEDYVPVVIRAFEEAAATEADRKFWKRLTKRVGAPVVLAATLLAAGVAAPSPAAAVEAHGLYIMRTKRRGSRQSRAPSTVPADDPANVETCAREGLSTRTPFRTVRRDPSLPSPRRRDERVRRCPVRLPRHRPRRSARPVGRVEAPRRVAGFA